VRRLQGILRSGELQYGDYQERALHEHEKAAGKALTCCTRPLTDVVFEVRELTGAKDLAIRTLPCRVEKVEKPAEDVAIISLKLPTGERLQFLAGQYIDILMRDGKRRSFSLANAPHDDAFLRLHVRKTPGGAFSKYVFEEMRERAILRFEGPLGTFYLREDSDKPFIFVAGGTGFAPVKAQIEHLFHKATTARWCSTGARARRRTSTSPTFRCNGGRASQLLVRAGALGPAARRRWNGRTGFVHQAVLDDFADLSGYQVYACGAAGMTDIAKQTFVEQRRLPDDEFYCDAFTPSVDPKR
jgi:CDP-4-dehydro-6-deoxyglucose reductase